MVGCLDISAFHGVRLEVSPVQNVVDAKEEVVGIVCYHRSESYFGIHLLEVAVFFELV